METVETIRQLYRFNLWANRRVIEALKQPSNQSPKALRALAHLLIAEKTWLLRMLENQDNTGFNFWEEASLAESVALAGEINESYRALFDTLTQEQLDQVATYKNSQGVQYSNSFRDILMHVFLHSMYHRGQVAMAVRAEGGEPAYTDYIAFVREQT